MSTMTTIMLMPPKATSLQHSNFKPSTLRSRSSPTKSSYPTVRMQTRFHRLIEDQGIVLMPGCYDALSAAIVQQSGFTAGFISGYALSASLLGKPDFGLLTPPEMAATARTVCAAASMIPIIADADTGGGNALNVQRTVRDFIAAGAAGCFLEDQAWPKKCGHMRGKQAGADACFVEAPRNDDELKEIGRHTKGYRVCNMIEGGVTPLHTPEELRAMGFHLIVHPLTALYASARALVDVLKNLKENGTTRDHLHKMATFEEFNQLVKLDSWFELEALYSNQKSPMRVKS
ncbi:carboxyvinyl-carboxyphosphonate phosphorylmutase, chloroplastic isoform X1 [Gossypium hirsutum]|uniref:Carboxyvinyl-carboxyphosphonate phosphorylmutase, chloroplastic isoform X1 n=1 Tax=Gossypium hirsutum TaxID=3635 RepID=A0A1U8NT53_GOSHI|nr:carboxyvinyl-carboxyphosphonate phosphorylmutase, chloroplastic isoform X1 [Gossypium hirsutum]